MARVYNFSAGPSMLPEKVLRQAQAELLYSLMEAGIPVSGFIREQGDLESIFMQITSHDKGKVVLSSEE